MPITTTRHYMIVARHPDWRAGANALEPLEPAQWLFQKNVRERTAERPDLQIEFLLADAAMLSIPDDQDFTTDKQVFSDTHHYICAHIPPDTAYSEFQYLAPFTHPNDRPFYLL